MPSLKQVIPYVVVGALAFLVGILTERFALGGLSAPIFVLTAIVAALIPIGGTIAQISFDQRRHDIAEIAKKREDHALRIAAETLLPLCRVEFYGSVESYSSGSPAALPLAVEIPGDANKRYVEGLRFWKYAIVHLLNDKEMRSRWEGLRAEAIKWNDLKGKLDRLTEERVSGLVERVIGPGYSNGPDWTSSPPAKWFNLFRYAAAIRQEGFLDLTFTVNSEIYRAGIGRPQTERFVARSGMVIYLGSDVEGELTPDKASEIYRELTTDRQLILGLQNLRESQREIDQLLPGFQTAAWEYCQRVEASQHLDGVCDVCKDYA